MIKDFFAFSATEVGYNHVKNGKVCEDASDFYDDDNLHLCVVADGHGSDNYPRTDRGSRMAVNAAIKCVIDFVKDADTQDVLTDEKHGFPMLLQLAKSILMGWHEAVDKDYLANPFTTDELKNVSEKYRRRYLSANYEERAIEKAYGCTLLIFVVTANYSFGIQIGDGKCVVVTNDGDFIEPIPWDENCQLNVTTSICDTDAVDEFRFFVSEELPAAVFCGSDGIDDSYANSEELYALYRSILKIFIEHGTEVGKNEIKDYLPVLTKKGSGDDVSVGLMIDVARTKRLAQIFEIQAEIFSLGEEIKKKKQLLNSNAEKDRALSMRIKQWLDSGKKTDDIDDARRINEIRFSRETIEEEIATIKRKLNELEESLLIKTEDIKTEDMTRDVANRQQEKAIQMNEVAKDESVGQDDEETDGIEDQRKPSGTSISVDSTSPDYEHAGEENASSQQNEEEVAQETSLIDSGNVDEEITEEKRSTNTEDSQRTQQAGCVGSVDCAALEVDEGELSQVTGPSAEIINKDEGAADDTNQEEA